MFFIYLHSLCDDILEVNRQMFPDSSIAAQMALKRKKCSEVVKVLGDYLTKKLAIKLQKNKFSLIIDESTDCSSDKACALVVKYYDKESAQIQTAMLDLINLYDGNEGASGESLFNLILKCLSNHQIPLSNMIGFAADGASNIMGSLNSVTSRLRKQVPGITIFRCVAHSIHLCSSEAAKTLPRKCEDLIRNVYTFFSHSAKRKHQFKDFQLFCGVKPHKILHPCATRWLSLLKAVERVVEQWQPLKLYFNDIKLEEKLESVDKICEALESKAIYAYILFLKYILPHLNTANLIFQTKGPTLHIAHDEISKLYLRLLNFFCLPHVLQRQKLSDVNPADPSIFLPVNQIYLGEDIHALFQNREFQNHSLVTEVKETCRAFLIKVCLQIKKRFDLDNLLWRLAACLHPKNVINPTTRLDMPSLTQLAKEVPRINNYNMQELADQWRDIAWETFPDEVTDKKYPIEIFYQYVLSLTDISDKAKYESFAHFAMEVLALPTSNTDVERLFSKFNLIKRKERSNLKLDTIKSLIHLQEYADEIRKEVYEDMLSLV
ncbi:uncharacterized protein LOC143020558 [Oratosquilla oratoria]|uniref:uncharacterized protein LOC143020558 n=1 Tax=Oratosquilla oratoria TaxID=337810 RepID=UPI003F7743C7